MFSFINLSVLLNTVCLVSNLVHAQAINAILNADQNGIINGFPNGISNAILDSTKCLTATYIDSKQVTSANQLPVPTLDSISGIPSPIKGSFIEIDLPTVDATIPNYKQVISVVTNKRGDLSTVKVVLIL
jgi:hypothetical protein